MTLEDGAVRRFRDFLGQSVPEPPPEGMWLGKYLLKREVARGGMGIVFEAEDPKLKRRVAVKVLKETEAGAEEVARLHREAAIAAQLRHPNIVPIHEVGMVRDDADRCTHYIAMDFVDGRTFAAVVRDPAVARGERLRMLEDVARAVAFAHSKGVVHRDLKPENVLVDTTGRVALTDFGLARSESFQTRLTASFTVMGTPAYMAPEQVKGLLPEVDARTDVYALGVMLYEALVGKPPFQADVPATLYDHILHREPARPTELDPSIERDVEVVCLKAMEKDRGHRYASAQEFADDIARVRRGEAIQARPPSFFYRLGKRLARRKALTIVSAAAIVVAGTLATVAVVSQRKARVSREQALTQLRKRTQMALEAALGFRRAGRLEEMRRYGAETEEACREAIRDFPDRPEPHHELGRMYRALMRDGDALAEQEAALRLDPRYAPALYERVVLLARRYRRLLAELIARAWREEGRLDEPSRRALGSKDPEMQALRARLAEDLRFLDSEAARGLQAWVKGETAAARESLSAAVKKPGAPEEAFEALATLEAEQGRYDESVRVWSRAIDADLGYLPHLEGRAGAYIEWGRSSGSREHFEKAVEDYATALGREPRITAWIGRGRARTEWAVRMENPAGLHQAAVEDFGEALKADPAAEEAWTGRGLARLNWGAFQQDRREDPSALYQLAVQDFGKALERNPDRDGTWSLRGLTHLYWGDWKKEPAAPYEAAIRDFDEAIRRSPVREWTWRYRAHARRKLGLVLEDQAKDPVERYEGAIADYGEALRRDASRGESWVMRGRTRVDLALWISGQGRDPEPLFRDAVGDFTGAMKFDPAARGLRADALATWALHRMEHGNDPSDQFRGAIGDYSAILDQTPADADAFARRGRAYEEWGRWTKRPEEYRAALRDYEAAVERDPKRADSLRKSIDFCRRMAQ